jgi:hypothetical protein
MDRKAFLDKLNLVKPCIGNNKLIPVLSYVLLKEDVISSYNGQEGIKSNFNHGLDCCVDGLLLINILSSYDTDTVDITQTGDSLIISSGLSKITIPVINSSSFIGPYITSLSTLFKTVITKEFIEGLSKCLLTSGKEKFKESELGVTIKTGNNEIKLYSTDGLRVSKFTMKNTSCQDFEGLLPPFFCSQVISRFNEEGAGEIEFSESIYIGSFPETVVFTQTKPIPLLDFEGRIFSKYQVDINTLYDRPVSLVPIIDRIKIVLDDAKSKAVKWFTDNNHSIVIEASANNSLKELIEFKENTLEPLDFNIDSALLDILKVVNKIGFYKVNDKIVIVGYESGFLTLIASI